MSVSPEEHDGSWKHSRGRESKFWYKEREDPVVVFAGLVPSEKLEGSWRSCMSISASLAEYCLSLKYLVPRSCSSPEYLGRTSRSMLTPPILHSQKRFRKKILQMMTRFAQPWRSCQMQPLPSDGAVSIVSVCTCKAKGVFMEGKQLRLLK